MSILFRVCFVLYFFKLSTVCGFKLYKQKKNTKLKAKNSYANISSKGPLSEIKTCPCLRRRALTRNVRIFFLALSAIFNHLAFYLSCCSTFGKLENVWLVASVFYAFLHSRSVTREQWRNGTTGGPYEIFVRGPRHPS